jgi:hypothetical protein
VAPEAAGRRWTAEEALAWLDEAWPEDVDDSRARRDWDWAPAYDANRAFEEYLIPTITKRYATQLPV